MSYKYSLRIIAALGRLGGKHGLRSWLTAVNRSRITDVSIIPGVYKLIDRAGNSPTNQPGGPIACESVDFACRLSQDQTMYGDEARI